MIRLCYINSRKSVFNYFFKFNRFLFVNATKICQFKASDWEIKIYALCLGNISKEFTAINMKKKTVLNGCIYKLLIVILLMLVILSIFLNM